MFIYNGSNDVYYNDSNKLYQDLKILINPFFIFPISETIFL